MKLRYYRLLMDKIEVDSDRVEVRRTYCQVILATSKKKALIIANEAFGKTANRIRAELLKEEIW